MRNYPLDISGLLELFWKKIAVGGPRGCWIWTGNTGPPGYDYGKTCITTPAGPKGLQLHRVFYETCIGVIPMGMVLGHSCDIQRCVNPKHLTPLTIAQNNRDAWKRGLRRAPHRFGEKNPMAKLTQEKADRIREIRRQANAKYSVIGEMFGVSGSNIHAICSGKTWTGVAYTSANQSSLSKEGEAFRVNSNP